MTLADDIEATKRDFVDHPVRHQPQTRLDKFWHVAGRVSVGISALALVVGIAAGTVALQTATCINTNNGVRSIPNTRDRAANETFVKSWNSDFGVLFDAAATQSAKTAAALDLKTALNTYVKVLDKDDALRAANPIGKC